MIIFVFYFVNSRSLSFFFQLVFKSIRGANFTSDMAIDDITIDAGTCQEGKVINIIFRKMRDKDVCFFFQNYNLPQPHSHFTKMTFSTNDFFIKYDKICSFLRIWSHLLKKFLMDNFILWTVLLLLFFVVEEETNLVPTPIPTKPPKVEAKPYVPRQIYGGLYVCLKYWKKGVWDCRQI